MIETLITPTAIILRDAQSCMEQHGRWPDLATGFAYRLLRSAGLQIPRKYQDTPTDPGPTALRRSPTLAAHGYLIGEASANIQRDWLAAFERLKGRDPFPTDRNSFVYNPLEVLGIAYGVVECPGATDDQRNWLSGIIQRGIDDKQFVECAAQLFTRCAIAKLDRSVNPVRFPAFPFDQLATIDLIFTSALSLTFPNCLVLDRTDIERSILDRILTQPLSIRDPAEAAATYVALRHILDGLAIHPLLQGNAVESVVTLCRRFQLFVDRLQHRQRSRPAVVIKDEYDVQDLLHAILKLHFDDVRPEEWTPSYAGNSSRVDFYLPREKTIVEAKMTRKGLGQAKVADELIIDRQRYASMEHVQHLVCFIYDPARMCSNPAALETDLAQPTGSLTVDLVVCPRGT